MEIAQLCQNPAALLQRLIRFNTTNPPGNERECILFLRDLLNEAGIETMLLGRVESRPNLIARIKGQGHLPPLLFQGHVDVVTTEGQDWRYPPFEGCIDQGYVWGRGAMDMKGGLTMMLSSCLRSCIEQDELPGDVVLAMLVDEEAGGEFGAKYLVEHHAECFRDIRYAIGESGGSTTFIGGHKFMPIQVSEKQVCWLQITLQSSGGHSSLPQHNGIMSTLGHMLQQIDQCRLPVHITSVPEQMVRLFAANLSEPMQSTFLRLLDPGYTDKLLDWLGPKGQHFDAMLHNTINVTMIQGGENINVLPNRIVLQLDGRVLPGYGPADLVAELQELIGADIQVKILRFDQGSAGPDMEFFSELTTALSAADPELIPLPYLMTATTDGRFFSRLGIQTYGFLPMNQPPNVDLASHVHAADERIPVAALDFGAGVLYDIIRKRTK